MEKKSQEKSLPEEEIQANALKEAGDEFSDLGKFRLSQDFSELAGVKKAILTVPVRKPGRQDFVRVRPGDAWQLGTAVLELKEERETYLIDPSLWQELPGEIVPKVLFTTINRQGVLTLWPIRLPGEDKRPNAWTSSALEAAQLAKRKWIRVSANMSLGAYEVCEAIGNIPEPTWPDITFEEILRTAFKDRLIRTVDHPAIRQLRGEV